MESKDSYDSDPDAWDKGVLYLRNPPDDELNNDSNLSHIASPVFEDPRMVSHTTNILLTPNITRAAVQKNIELLSSNELSEAFLYGAINQNPSLLGSHDLFPNQSIQKMGELLIKNPRWYLQCCERDRNYRQYIFLVLDNCQDDDIIDAIPIQTMNTTAVLALFALKPELKARFKERQTNPYDVEKTWGYLWIQDRTRYGLLTLSLLTLVFSIAAIGMAPYSLTAALLVTACAVSFALYFVAHNLKTREILERRLYLQEARRYHSLYSQGNEQTVDDNQAFKSLKSK